MTGAEKPARPPGGLAGAVLAVRFLTELVLLAGLAWLGVLLGGNGLAAVALAVAGVAAGVVLWGTLLAPKARRRLPDPIRLVVEILLFGGTAAALAGMGHTIPAVIGGAVGVVVAVLVRIVVPGE